MMAQSETGQQSSAMKTGRRKLMGRENLTGRSETWTDQARAMSG